ncbi:MAG TPA: nucleotidyltransferase family protein [Kiritimatiellia bacterium]|nr:nucleotidyltransferase family protein [Kiritimatiellia bacterium]HMO98989.1 nucleotidyltransferase family protein [Kiritimatiellia bacterium]HMP95876.1 nucleotidyltransferase family protein [Kiritimatiellia bacterium]
MTPDADARRFLREALFAADPPPMANNWDEAALLGAASRHGIAPLLHERLRETASLPPRLRKSLEAHYYSTAQKNHYRIQAAGEALGALQRSGVRVLVLKGAGLAERLYRNIALRPFEDIDLLIQPKDFAAAREALRTLGYQPPDCALPDAHYRRHHFHIALIRKEPAPVYLELHWGFTDPFLLYTPDMDAVWARATEALHPADEWLYLAMHLAKHGVLIEAFYRLGVTDPDPLLFAADADIKLIWLVDLHRHAERYVDSLDPVALGETARQWGAWPTLQATRYLLRLTTGRDPFPQLSHERPGPPSRWRNYLLKKVICGGESSGRSFWTRMRPDTQFRPIRVLDMLRYLFPPGEFLTRRYRIRGWLALTGMRILHPVRALGRDVISPLVALAWLRIRR